MTISDIITLPFGVCDFEELSPYLFDTRNRSEIPSNAKSIISVLFPYFAGEENYRDRNISRYAVPRDYHITANRILSEYCEKLSKAYPGKCFVHFADNSPVPEVFAAVKCGLGVKGRNGLLINRRYGSYVFLGEIITDAYFTPTCAEINLCEGCGRCEKMCPGGAITDGKIDREKCFSAISQQKKDLTEKQIEVIKSSGICWGCDICQEVCPYNAHPEITPISDFIDTCIAHIDENTSIENRAFGWRGEKVIKRNIGIIK